MKVCIKCETEKEFSEFGKVSKNKDGLNSMCKLCKRAYDNQFHHQRSEEKKAEKYSKQQERIGAVQKYVIEYMNGKTCEMCPENRLPALDFHHHGDKEFNISNAIQQGYSLNKIQVEIEKCSILCANCHRVETAKQFNWYNKAKQ